MAVICDASGNGKHHILIGIFVKHKASVIFKFVAFVSDMFCDIRDAARSYALHIEAVLVYGVAAVVIVKRRKRHLVKSIIIQTYSPRVSKYYNVILCIIC